MTLLREHTTAVRELLHGHRVHVDGAGATSVVFVGSPDAPDPGPLLQALAALRRNEPGG